MVPTLLSSSISVLVQSIFVIIGTVLLIQLESNDTFSQITSYVASKNYGALASILLSQHVLYPMVAYFGAAVVLTAIVTILASGFTYSAEYLSYLRAMNNNSERVRLPTVFSFLKDKWQPMAWTFFLVQLFTFLPVVLFTLLGVGVAYVGGPSIVSLFSISGLAILGLIFTGITALVMIYAMVAVAADNLSGISAIRKSYRVVRSNLGISLIYAIVTLVGYIVITLVAELVTNIGVPLTSIASIAITLLIIPVLHMTKTSIYIQSGANSSEIALEELLGPTSGSKDLLGGPFFRFALSKLKQGIYALKDYALNWRNLPYHLASTAALIIGVLVGENIGRNGLDSLIFALGYTPGVINPTILGDVPLTAGLDIFLHNWEVSLSTALSGIWLVAPTLATIGFNGMILGVVYYLTPNFTMFAAAIFPHGSIELPSFVLSGSAGMRLGVYFLRTIGKGKDSTEEQRFEAVARETIYIIIGLAILFFIAGIIEGNITPIIMRMYGWK
jgi:uncharacterized membrane protein SpoIIM required for sporulation